jgi:dTDP-glucose pyrophosphorylase
VLRLLTKGNCHIIRLKGDTKGAVCSALMAIEHINNQDELVIVNADSIIEHDLNQALNYFRSEKADGGVISFNSVHPKWSYVRLDDKGKIVEAAEKMPISTDAIAGFYYFGKGTYFVDSAMKSIEKEASVNDLYYIAPVFNELVLSNMNLLSYKIPKTQYHSFYSPQKIKEYERSHPIQGDKEETENEI